MSDFDLGTARGKIVIDSSGAEYGIGRVTTAQDQMAQSSRRSADQMVRSGTVMVGASTAIVGGFGIAINAAATFEERISGIAAVSGATADELDTIRQKALQLGADTKFSASEAAGAMEELIKAGLSVSDVMNGAADATVNLAAAGEIDLTSAATVAANAMNSFNLAAEDLPRVADLIAGAANASAIDVGEFAMAMQQSAAVANLAGLSFDDLSVAIAAMGNAGIRGSDAGTSLKTFMQNLQPVTEKQINLFRELGILTEDGTNAFYDQAGALKPLSEVAQILQDSMAGMTDQQKQLTLETLFGSDAIRAAAVIADEGAAGFNTLAAAMGEVTAQEVAETRMDNLAGSVEQLKGSVETLLIIIGRPLADALRAWVDRLVDLVNWISALDPETLAWAVTIGKVVAAILGGVGAFFIMVGVLEKIKLAFIALRVALIAHPLLLIVTAVLALGYALYTLYQRNEAFRESVQDAFEWIRENVIPTIQGMVEVLTEVGQVLADVGEEVVGEVAERFDWFQEHVFPVLVAFGQLNAATARRIGQVVGFIIEQVRKLEPVFRVIFGAIRAVIEGFVGTVLAVWRNFGDNILRAIELVWQTVMVIVDSALRVIQGVIQTITGLISGDWSKAWEGIRNIFGGVWDFIKALPGIVLDWIRLAIQQAFDAFLTMFQSLDSTLRAIFGSLWETLKSIVSTALGAIKGAVTSALGDIVSFFAGLPGRVTNALGNLLGTLVGKGWDLVQGFWNGIQNNWALIVGWLQGLPGRIADTIGDLGRLLYDIGKSVIQGLWDGMKAIWNNTAGWIGGLADKILRLKGPEPKDKKLLIKPGEWIIGSLLEGMQRELPKVLDLVSGIAPTIQANVESQPLTPSPTPLGGTTTVAPQFVFPGVTSAREAEAIEQTLTDSGVIATLTRSIRAGVGRN